MNKLSYKRKSRLLEKVGAVASIKKDVRSGNVIPAGHYLPGYYTPLAKSPQRKIDRFLTGRDMSREIAKVTKREAGSTGVKKKLHGLHSKLLKRVAGSELIHSEGPRDHARWAKRKAKQGLRRGLRRLTRTG